MTRIKFEDLPSTNTPINAENLNKLNNVIVSSEEPTTGEEVWLQKGKNLYNESQYPLTYNRALNPEDGATYSTSSGNYYATECYVPIDGANISKITFSSNVTISFYDGTKKFISGGTDNQTYNVPSNARYLRFDIHKNNINNIQIEKGEIATQYEPFIPKKIHTKTDNGVYEEFYNEEDREVVLYDGDTTGDVTLKDSAYNYKYIEVILNVSNMLTNVKVPGDATFINCGVISCDTTDTNNPAVIIHGKYLRNKGTTLFAQNAGRIYKYVSHNTFTQDKNAQVYVKKVIGYRY